MRGHPSPPHPPKASAVLRRWAAGRPSPGSRKGGSARGREGAGGRGAAGRRAARRGAASCARRRVGAEPSAGWPAGAPPPAPQPSDAFREQRRGRQDKTFILGLFKVIILSFWSNSNVQSHV